MTRLIQLVCLTLVMSSCDTITIKVEDQTRLPVKSPSPPPAKLLFEHEGCKVYKFKDSYSWHYFSRCGGPSTQVIN